MRTARGDAMRRPQQRRRQRRQRTIRWTSVGRGTRIELGKTTVRRATGRVRYNSSISISKSYPANGTKTASPLTSKIPKQPEIMSNTKRRRHHSCLLIATTTTILFFIGQHQASGQKLVTTTSAAPSQTPNSQYTYQPLVNQQHRHQSSQDLDNVIESTSAPPAGQCQLPPTWTGRWYQANKEPIRVTNTEISDKGVCRDQKGDKYLFEMASANKQQQQQQQACLVCLVINERHLNVLQYKESTCQPLPPNYQPQNRSLADDHSLLESICSDITGDAQLESLFRLDTPAIECPIAGSFSFTYESCREPQSQLDSCIDKKQLNFKFAACPDVAGSESKSEVLKCYADWSEANNYYMIGRLEHASNHQDKGKFRCFVYEKSADGKFIQMAQSVEESCYGLINANEGPKTLRLTVKPPTVHKCQFPSYIQAQSENWLSVDNSLIYMFNQNSSKYQVKETKEGTVNEEATCLQQYTYPTQMVHHPHTLHHALGRSNQQQVYNTRRYPPQAATEASPTTRTTPVNEAVYLVQITKNCHTANYCVRFYKRSNGIVQIDYFNASSPASIDGANCRNAFVETPQTQIITSTNLERQRCPFDGAYTIEAPIESDLSYNPSNIFICPRQSFMTAQCEQQQNRLRIHSKCSPQKYSIKNLYCLGRWTNPNGLVRLVLDDDERQRYSAWYRDYTQESGDQAPVAITTRSQQLLAGSSSQQQYLPHVVDMQITLISPLPHPVKSMHVRLVKRSQCSELRGYSSGQGPYGGGASSSISSSSMQQSSYTSSAANYCSPSSTTLLIVTLLLMPLLTCSQILQPSLSASWHR